jgi:hypothetical protein
VSQISPPVRILLAGAIIVLAAWFTVLKPKAATVDPPAPVSTPSTALGKDVAKAKGAAAATESASKAHNGEPQTKTESGSAAKTQTATSGAQADSPAVAIPADVLAKLPHDVSSALKQHDTLVLGVIADGATRVRPLADDDRYVRQALRKVNHYHGQVTVKTVPVGHLARFAPIVGDLDINQTPSVVVVGGDLKGRVLTGYVDTIAINQAIADARRDSIHPYVKDQYLRRLNRVCSQFYTSVERWSLPTIRGKKAAFASLDRAVAIFDRYHSAVARIPAPAKWRGLKAQFVKVMASREATIRTSFGQLKHNKLSAAYATVQTFDFAQVRALDRRFDAAGVTSCSLGRRS